MGSSGLIDDLRSIPAGPALASAIAYVEALSLNPGERVGLVQARQRLISHYQAGNYRDLSAVFQVYVEMFGDIGEAFESAVMEIRPALHYTKQSAEMELSDALVLTDKLTPVLEALRRGDLDSRRARIFVAETCHLDDDPAAKVAEAGLADGVYMTSGQLRVHLRKLCLEIEPESAALRYREGVADRKLASYPELDGTASIHASNLPPERVEAAMNAINRIARGLRTKGEMRTMDQLRADVFLDLLAGHPEQRAGVDKGIVDITVDLATLARLSEEPGELNGYGPIVADLARQLAESQPESQWRYRIVDQESNQVVLDGLTRRRPKSALRRRVEQRDQRCVFPGCRVPARRCDIDHIRPWADGGATTEDNGAPNCESDHVGRHRGPWHYKRLDQGDYLWTSPLGLRYRTSGRPPPEFYS